MTNLVAQSKEHRRHGNGFTPGLRCARKNRLNCLTTAQSRTVIYFNAQLRQIRKVLGLDNNLNRLSGGTRKNTTLRCASVEEHPLDMRRLAFQLMQRPFDYFSLRALSKKMYWKYSQKSIKIFHNILRRFAIITSKSKWEHDTWSYTQSNKSIKPGSQGQYKIINTNN